MQTSLRFDIHYLTHISMVAILKKIQRKKICMVQSVVQLALKI